MSCFAYDHPKENNREYCGITENMVIKKMIQGIPMKEYASIHAWLRTRYGRANKCSFQNCSGLSKKFNWALLREKKYKREVNNFTQLCRRCHSLYDCTEETRKKVSKALKGKKQSRDLVESRIAPLRGRKRPKHVIEALKKALHKPVIQILNGKRINRFPSLRSAAETVGVTDGAIWSCINGLNKSCRGFQWKYE